LYQIQIPFCINGLQLLFATVLKSFRLQSCLLSETETAEADILVRPAFEPDNPVSFSQREEAIMAGYRAAADTIPTLKAKIAAWQPRPE
jgi:NTE family protein